MPRRLASALLVLLLLATAGAAGAQPASLGETSFPNSGAEAAQAPFLRGLLLLHSFEYEDAREAFQAARAADPGFAMAYWGEAMTHNHPIWMEQDADAARAVLAALASTPEARQATAPTARERAYLAALEVLYGDGDKEARDDAYAAAMADVADAYPDDPDAAAFAALAVLGTAHEGRDFATYMRAAALAEEVFARHPRHPGAAHYLIHAYDDPVHAPLGLRAAHVYADIAPAASHALHMPTHIYFALGQWEEAAALNVRSFEAARARTDRRGEALNGHGWHALYWRVYAELQRGRYAEARRLIGLADSLAAADPRRAALPVGMRAHYVMETEDWDWAPDGDLDGLYAAVRILQAKGAAALARGDRSEAERAFALLQPRVDEAGDAPKAQIALLELLALLHLDAGETDAAFRALDEATALEDALPLDFGPPDPVKPSHELYGEVLLAEGRPAEARAQFEAALARAPGRTRSLLGLARAAEAAGDAEAAADAYAAAEANWRRADADVRRGQAQGSR